MHIKEIAQNLVAGCRDRREVENLDKLYAKDAVSVESTDNGQGREAKGLDAIKGKHDWWNTAMEVEEASVSDPMFHGEDRFAVIFDVKAKEKASGSTFEMKEVGIYHVADGKIIREEFFNV